MTMPEEQVPGQQTIDDVTPDPTPTDAGTDATASVETADNALSVSGDVRPSESASEGSAPDPTVSVPESSQEQPATNGTTETGSSSSGSTEQDDEHWFRVTHQLHAPGNPSPHSIRTTDITYADEAIVWLAKHAHDLPAVIAALQALL